MLALSRKFLVLAALTSLAVSSAVPKPGLSRADVTNGLAKHVPSKDSTSPVIAHAHDDDAHDIKNHPVYVHQLDNAPTKNLKVPAQVSSRNVLDAFKHNEAASASRFAPSIYKDRVESAMSKFSRGVKSPQRKEEEFIGIVARDSPIVLEHVPLKNTVNKLPKRVNLDPLPAKDASLNEYDLAGKLPKRDVTNLDAARKNVSDLELRDVPVKDATKLVNEHANRDSVNTLKNGALRNRQDAVVHQPGGPQDEESAHVVNDSNGQKDAVAYAPPAAGGDRNEEAAHAHDDAAANEQPEGGKKDAVVYTPPTTGGQRDEEAVHAHDSA